VKSHGGIVVDWDEATGRSFLRSGRADPPFSVRWCDGRVLVAASAAAPLGGDELSLDIAVGAGATADVGTVASTIVLPGAVAAQSFMTTNCVVGDGAHLDWVGEPTVSVVGSDHEVITTVDLAASATCRIVEEVSLGRAGEPSGRLRLVVRVERAGRVLVHHEELFGPGVPGVGSTVSTANARHVLSAVHVGVEVGDARVIEHIDGRAAWLPVATDAAVVLAVGVDRPAVLRLAGTVSDEDRHRMM
jgi:urease accessory protein